MFVKVKLLTDPPIRFSFSYSTTDKLLDRLKWTISIQPTSAVDLSDLYWIDQDSDYFLLKDDADVLMAIQGSIDYLVRLSTTPKKSLNMHSCSTYDENCSQCLNGAVSYLKDQEDKCSRRLGRTENRDFRRHSPSSGSNFGSECSRSHSGVVRFR